jgi:hypothetical protein
VTGHWPWIGGVLALAALIALVVWAVRSMRHRDDALPIEPIAPKPQYDLDPPTLPLRATIDSPNVTMTAPQDFSGQPVAPRRRHRKKAK